MFKAGVTNRIILLAGLLACSTWPAVAATWTVDADHTGLENGSLFFPFNTIQEGIDASASGDVVRLRRGTYKGAGNRDLDTHGKSIHIRSIKGPKETIIDCEGLGRGFYIHNGESRQTVIEGLRITGVNGVAFETNGLPWDSYYLLTYGTNSSAVLLQSNSSPTFRDCEFVTNRAYTFQAVTTVGIPGHPPYSIDDARDGDGGAVRCEQSSPLFVDCLFSDNGAGAAGGAIYAVDSRLELQGCAMTGNSAGTSNRLEVSASGVPSDAFFQTQTSITRNGPGGAIIASNCEVILRNCTLLQNGGGAGGALQLVGCTNVNLSDCVFVQNGCSGNTSPADGGAIALVNSRAWMTNVSISGSGAGSLLIQTMITIGVPYDPFYRVSETREGRGSGGGLSLKNSSVSATNLVVSGCTAMEYGAGIFCVSNSVLKVSDLRVIGNQLQGNYPSPAGGGLFASRSTVDLERATFRSNAVAVLGETTIITIGVPTEAFFQRTTNRGFRGVGGAAAFVQSECHVRNSEWAFNQAAEAGGAVYAASGSVVTINAAQFYTNSAVSQVADVHTIATIEDVESSHAYFASQYAGIGGAMAVVDSELNVERVVARGNVAGGAGGGLYMDSGSMARLSNTVLHANAAGMDTFASWRTEGSNEQIQTELTATSAGSGGGIFSAASIVVIMSSTIAANMGMAFEGDLSIQSTSLLIGVNAVIWSNGIPVDASSTAACLYCCTPTLYPGTGNISADPMLAAGWRLSAVSPCIDAGTGSGAPGTDVDGESRQDDPTHANAVSIFDIGADEFVDADADGIGDAWEVQQFGTTPTNAASDSDQDGLGLLAEYLQNTDPASADSDGDTMPDGWETTEGTDPRRRDEFRDADGDGYTHQEEFIAATAPFDALDYFVWTEGALLQAPGSPQLGWLSASNRIYTINATTNLADSVWATVTNVAGTGGWMQFEDATPDAASRTYRLGVTLQP